MKRRISIFLVILILQTISFVIPKTRAQEKDLAETKSKEEIQRILKLRIEVKTREEEEILKAMSLKCEWGENVEDSELSRREAVCNATVNQMNQLKQTGIKFEVQREGIKIEKGGFGYKRVNKGKGSAYDDNENNYTIPEGDWNHSPITIISAPPTATVTSIDVYYEVIHTYIGDLVIKLTDQNLEHEWILWYYEGGSGDNIQEAEWDITEFNGELVNLTWKLWGWDCCAGYDGYIDYWSIQIWYEDLPDLIVQSLTATDYNPNVGDYIDVTMVIKNQGSSGTDWFWTDLFLNESFPPSPPAVGDYYWETSLGVGETESHTFYNITSSVAETWQMYGLTDSEDAVCESKENNNVKGPVTINWTYSPPDLIVQNLTVDNPSLTITEHTNGTITIKNQGSGPVVDCFYTDVFKNRSSAPSPPATGEYFYEFCWLDPGETICYNFYKLPHSTSAGTWKMWGLVDSEGDIAESNEGNNVYGPVNITWLDPPSPHQVSRADMINHALEFLNVNWTCSNQNTTPHWSCPIWRCWFTPSQSYTGEAYSWGGWDKPNTDFLTYLSAGLCVGSIKDSTCGAADPYWATGVDCAGLVSRCWETNARKSCSDLLYISDQITINDLQSGDIMSRTGEHAHVMMFYQWVVPYSIMQVIESTPPQATDDNNYDTLDLVDDGYVPRKYKWVYDPGNNDPVIDTSLRCKYPQEECGDCIKFGEEVTIEIFAHDPDGDLIQYEWWCYWGYFIVDGNPVYACTTVENYVIYQAPTWWSEDDLYVYVRDDRGGDTLASYHIEVFDSEYTCICGDVTDNGIADIGDVTFLLNYLYKYETPAWDSIPPPQERADVNCDAEISIGDVVHLLNFLFGLGQPEWAPLECGWFPPE